MKRIVISLLIVINIFSLSAQHRMYREWGKSRIMSESEFVNMQNVLVSKLKKRFSDARIEYSIEKETISKSDTLHDVKLTIKFDGEKSIHLSNLVDTEAFKNVGKHFPDFYLKGLDGKNYTLKDFKGKPMLINYWFKTCGPCKAEMPALNKLKQQYGDNVHFIAITYDNKAHVEGVLREHPFDFLQLIEAKALIDKLKINGAPKNIFVDKNGIIRQMYEKVDDIYDAENQTVSLGEGKEFMKILDELLKE